MASAQMIGSTVDRVRTDPTAVRRGRARDWAEIQERMLVPLYLDVYRRLEVGAATSLLGVGCRSGLALLLAEGRGAQVAGVEADGELRELARARGLQVGSAGAGGAVARSAHPVPRPAHSLVTVFEQPPTPGAVARAAERVLPGGQLVVAAWGPAEHCESAAVLAVAGRYAPSGAPDPFAPDPFAAGAPGGLESLLAAAGTRPVGGGTVGCPFAYAGLDSAVRGLLSTGLFDRAERAAGPTLLVKELEEALHPYLRPDGSVRMANVFRWAVGTRPRS
ncbi:class I SAM-dependent methyltransferase [Kitasatospora sp. NPDC088134]|uniref:class I SAM-dependent methyltransferase n=1 Tax=Kitasatospora sp. NPDC088134 TaxID=3364071 RepID=UPI00382DA150